MILDLSVVDNACKLIYKYCHNDIFLKHLNIIFKAKKILQIFYNITYRVNIITTQIIVIVNNYFRKLESNKYLICRIKYSVKIFNTAR
jgi:hypothetical protein